MREQKEKLTQRFVKRGEKDRVESGERGRRERGDREKQNK